MYDDTQDENSSYLGLPAMIQLISGYNTLTAYVSISNFGNIAILSWNRSMDNGSTLYTEPMHTPKRKNHFLIFGLYESLYASPIFDRGFVFTRIEYDSYINKVLNSPTPAMPSGKYDSGNKRQNSRSSSVCTLCNGSGQHFKASSPDYTGNATKKWCSICNANMYPHYHSKCPSCNGKGRK